MLLSSLSKMRLLLFLGVLGVNAQSVVFERLAEAPVGWTALDTIAPDQEAQFDIYVAPARFDRLEQSVLSASTPGHSEYGKHLSLQEVNQLLTPAPRALKKIDRWLATAGITDVVIDELQFTFRAKLSQVEKLLKTRFAQFEDQGRNVVTRTLEYSVPAELEDYIDMIQPTTRFPRAKRRKTKRDLSRRSLDARQSAPDYNNCTEFVTPACLRKLYNIGETHNDLKVKNTLAVNSFDSDYSQYDDLADFQQQFAPWTKGRNFTWTSINGEWAADPARSGPCLAWLITALD